MAAPIKLSRTRLRSFAEAIGECDPRYTDVDHARSLGHPDLPVPLTYLFTLESESTDTLDFMSALDVEATSVLHGEQAFTYLKPLHAGQVVEIEHVVIDDVTKPGTGLRIIRRHTDVSVEGELACRLSSTWIIRGG